MVVESKSKVQDRIEGDVFSVAYGNWRDPVVSFAAALAAGIDDARFKQKAYMARGRNSTVFLVRCIIRRLTRGVQLDRTIEPSNWLDKFGACIVYI